MEEHPIVDIPSQGYWHIAKIEVFGLQATSTPGNNNREGGQIWGPNTVNLGGKW